MHLGLSQVTSSISTPNKDYVIQSTLANQNPFDVALLHAYKDNHRVVILPLYTLSIAYMCGGTSSFQIS